VDDAIALLGNDLCQFREALEGGEGVVDVGFAGTAVLNQRMGKQGVKNPVVPILEG
jgi:hypothetical protein